MLGKAVLSEIAKNKRNTSYHILHMDSPWRAILICSIVSWSISWVVERGGCRRESELLICSSHVFNDNLRSTEPTVLRVLRCPAGIDRGFQVISRFRRHLGLTDSWPRSHTGIDPIPNKKNRPFPNYLWPLFQSESWCSSFHMKISFYSHANENSFS